MQKIHGDNLSDIYGEDIEEVPIKVINIIRELISTLNYYLVEYIDITGYNFMLDSNENLWIIDFGHARCREKDDKVDSIAQVPEPGIKIEEYFFSDAFPTCKIFFLTFLIVSEKI